MKKLEPATYEMPMEVIATSMRTIVEEAKLANRVARLRPHLVIKG